MNKITGQIRKAVLKQGARLVSPSGKKAHLSILIYHRVLPDEDALLKGTISASTFDAQMAALAGCFNVLPLREAVERLKSNSLPERAACITFDDGYADNAEIAMPILQKHGLVATFFVAYGYLDGGIMWNDVIIETIRNTKHSKLDLSVVNLDWHNLDSPDRRATCIQWLVSKLKYVPQDERTGIVKEIANIAQVELPSSLMMSTDQVRSLHQSQMEIGAHTISHPILARLSVSDAKKEIIEGRRFLEEAIRAPVSLFAYPNGKPGADYNAEHVKIVKNEGFHAACSTVTGVAMGNSDLYQLPRFTPWDKDPAKYILRLLHNNFKAARGADLSL